MKVKIHFIKVVILIKLIYFGGEGVGGGGE